MGLAGLGLNVVLSFTAWALYPSSGLSLENEVLGAETDHSPDERSLLPLQDAEKEENGSVQEDEDEEEEEMTTL